MVTGAEPPLDSTELFDETAAGGAGAFVTVAHMATRRESLSATLLADGTVLAVGGLNTTATVTSSAELFALNPCAPSNTPVGRTSPFSRPTPRRASNRSP